MPTQYDFQELDRSITSLEKNASKYIASFDEIMTAISKAKFNEKEYGERALSQKIAKVVDNAKSKITSSYNNYVNSLRRIAHDSLERVKESANSASDYCEDWNDLLSALSRLNTDFSEKNYRDVIESNLRVELYPEEITNYVTLLKLESFDAICRSDISDRSIDHYNECKQYYTTCKQKKASNHLSRAALLLFYASYALSEEPKDDLYDVYIDGLKGYADMSDSHKASSKTKYLSLYSRALSIFNAQCELSYSSFDYLKVKSLLNDSRFFSEGDITVDFFKDHQCTPEKLFAYVLTNGQSASRETMQIVLDDTKGLSLGLMDKEYFGFWLDRYDEYGFVFIKQLIEGRNDRFLTEQIIAGLIPAAIEQNKKSGTLVYDLVVDYQAYLESISDQVPLLKFAQTAVKWSAGIKNTSHITDIQERMEFDKAVELLDGLSYSMIVKYQKYCNCFDANLINELNVVLDESSNRLFGKPYKKDLIKTEKDDDSADSILVKLVSVQLNKKRRKKGIIWVSILVAIAIIVAVIILLTKK